MIGNNLFLTQNVGKQFQVHKNLLNKHSENLSESNLLKVFETQNTTFEDIN